MKKIETRFTGASFVSFLWPFAFRHLGQCVKCWGLSNDYLWVIDVVLLPQSSFYLTYFIFEVSYWVLGDTTCFTLFKILSQTFPFSLFVAENSWC